MVELIRKNNSGQVSAFHDACMFHWILGNGILNGAYASCESRIEGNEFIISSGLISIFGRIAQILPGQEERLSIPDFSKKYYVFLVLNLEEDDSASSVEFVIDENRRINAGNGFPTNPGSYVLQFATINSSTNFTLDISLLDPGVAKNALNLSKEGKIGSWDFNEVFDDSIGSVKYCANAQVTAEAHGFIGGTINEVDENLYMPNRGCYLLEAFELVKSTSFSLEKGGSVRINMTSDIKTYPSRVFTAVASDSSGYMDGKPIALMEVANECLNTYGKNIAIQISDNNNDFSIGIDRDNKQVIIKLNDNASIDSANISNFSLVLYGYGEAVD